ncbi:hypothetical protein ANCCAN_18163 [Ancylostoma caninum]|uniref:Uncharacterized protein n=1 Tax=Ancylostoma caninum TaxID=29170 RepID=A0A368FYZ2_ANCCA|nr:hypothetical protein ANCCAN_18163 [Ancylostoma caninum]
MTGIRRGSSFADTSKLESLRKQASTVHFEENGPEEARKNDLARKRHHSLLLTHFVSTLFHLISSVLLYLSWNSADVTCGETSVFLTNLQAVLIGIYGLTIVVKVFILIKHFFHLRFPAKYITVILSLIAGKQFVLAVICEVFLEASTMVPRTGCRGIRGTLPVLGSRIFYLLSIVINAFFFAVAAKLHPAEE